MEKVLKNKFYISIFIMPALAIFIMTFVIPILQTVYGSFFKWDGINSMEFIFLNNYIKALTKDPIFWPALTIKLNGLGLLSPIALAVISISEPTAGNGI